MDKSQALYTFWSSFSLPAYDENTVPADAVMPYITYNMRTAKIDEPVFPSASLWYYSTLWEEISKKADEIAEYISKMSPPTIKIDNGRVYITTGVPFAQRMSDPDSNIRRIYLNINVEFFTEY